MTINLSKSQVINLSKASSGLDKVIVGLGWDPVDADTPSGGFLKKLFGGSEASSHDIDCDAFCVALDKQEHVVDTIYFGHKTGCSGSIVHTGDNLTGEGEGDDEQIIFYLHSMPAKVDKIKIAVNIYQGKQRGQHFGTIKNAFIRIVDTKNNSEMCSYKLSGKEYNHLLTVVFGELYRDASGDWQFKAIGEGDKAESISQYINRFR